MLTSLQHMVFFYVPVHRGMTVSVFCMREVWKAPLLSRKRGQQPIALWLSQHISDNDLTPTDMIPQLYWMCSNGSGSA